jgi:signal transduction histidine kinase
VEPVEPDDVVKAAERERIHLLDRAIRRMGQAGVVAATLFGLLAWWNASATLAVGLIFTIAVTMYGISQLHGNDGRPTAASYVGLTVYVLALAATSLSLGGVAPGVTPWLAGAPLLITVYGDRRLGLYSLGLVWVALCVMFAVTVTWAIPPYGHLPGKVLMQVLGSAGATGVWFGGSWYIEDLHAGALRRAHDTNLRLVRELDDHRRTRAALEAANARTADAARAAGRAEIATGVLHNIGNALNSVNVSANLARERVDDELALRLRRAAGVLGTAPPDELARFLLALADKAEGDARASRSELTGLCERLSHVNTVVQAQQAHARSAGLVTEVRLEEIVRQAVALTQRGREYAADVEIEVDAVPTVTVEGHKLLQVLANLIGNARDAVSESGRRGRVRVRARRVADDVAIDVIDDGVGVPRDVVDRLFQHGFTTKPTGHGFGLHVSALVAGDLGGSLRARSDGAGHGATFTLQFPTRPPPRSPVTPATPPVDRPVGTDHGKTSEI